MKTAIFYLIFTTCVATTVEAQASPKTVHPPNADTPSPQTNVPTSSRAGESQQPLRAVVADRTIIAGERIGGLKLSMKEGDIQNVFGPSTKTIDGPWRFSKTAWWKSSYVEFDPATGNVFLIGIGASGSSPFDVDISSSPWAAYSLPNGIRFGSKREDVAAALGPPERTVSAGGSTSLYYDKIGIRFTVTDISPEAGKVGQIRIVWPSVPHGDNRILPGQRISSVEVGATLESALKLLGGGYHRGEGAPGYNVYYWPHLALSFVEANGRIISVRAARDRQSDAFGIRYTIGDKLGLGSSSSEVEAILGKASRAEPVSSNMRSWLYDPLGVSFFLDAKQLVTAVDVFAPAPRGSAVDHLNRATSHFQKRELDLAIIELTKVIELDPDNAEAYNSRAYIYLLIGKPTQALSDARTSLRLRPDDPYTLDTRGHIFEALGRREEAIADYRRALEKMPSLTESSDGLKRLGATP